MSPGIDGVLLPQYIYMEKGKGSEAVRYEGLGQCAQALNRKPKQRAALQDQIARVTGSNGQEWLSSEQRLARNAV